MIRPLVAADRAPVLRLLRATGRFTDAEVGIAEELVDIVLGRPAQTDYHAFVAVPPDGRGGEVHGFLLLGPTPATIGTWHLYWIAVSPEHEGRGVAQRLDELAEEIVKRHRGYWLLAETSGTEAYGRAHAFYRKRRYAEVARIGDYYRPGDDLVVFGKRV